VTHAADVTVTVLGCGDAFGSGGRLNTCFHVAAGDVRFLIDCGASSLISMKRFGVDPQSIDVILVSHLHGDHFGGITFLDRETQIAATRSRPLVVAGPAGITEKFDAALEALFPGSLATPRTYPLEVRTLTDGEENRVGALRVRTAPVIHTPGTNPHALRVEIEGRIIAYSGDTEWTDALLEIARGADLFICEAYTFDRKARNHMDLSTLAAQRERLGCRRLLLTHLGDEMLARLPVEGFEVASDGMTLAL
jgi:ribonuclease BN (tRNA processing enzyme)